MFCRLETVKTILVLIAALMGALTLMIIFVGFLATGATRRRVYKAWRTRVGGRISCAVVRIFTYKTHNIILLFRIIYGSILILILIYTFYFLVYEYYLHTSIFLDFCVWLPYYFNICYDCVLEYVY